MKIVSEGCVRKAMKDALGKAEHIRVEQSAGSTFGVSDLLVPLEAELLPVSEGGESQWRRELMPIELKAASEVDGWIHFSLRPSQHRFFRAMWDLRVRCAVVVGLRGTDRLFFLPNCPATWDGHVKLDSSVLCDSRWVTEVKADDKRAIRSAVKLIAGYMPYGRYGEF